jgi:4-amino-4-deoxy-L-arabinose transferase-like glycosyltransferase
MRSNLAMRIGPLLLLTILLASLGPRLWGSGFGLPAYTLYHPDEHALVDRAAEILWTGDWNLHRFNYPPFYAYVQAGGYATYFLWGASQGSWDQIMPFALPKYYQIGRLITALFGTLTILIVYLVGREVRGKRSGLLAAALLGGCYLHVIHSHYATFDVMLAFLVALALLFSVLIQERRQAKWYFLAGLSAGLAGATKYNGAVVFVLPLLAHVLTTPWGEWGWLDGRLLLSIGGFLLGFFGGNPFAVGNLPDFLNGLATVLFHYGTEQPGFEGRGNWRWYLQVFLTSVDALWVVAGAAGLATILWRNWKKGLLLVTFPLVYFLLVSRFVVRFERNMVPLLPFLAVGGGWLLEAGAEWLTNKWRATNSGQMLAAHLLSIVACCIVLALPLAASLSFDGSISQTDLREIAGEWLMDNVEWGSKIAIEHYSIPFDHTEYWVQDVMRITDHDLDWYQQEKFDILVISDGVWDVLRRDPASYADKLAAYDNLVHNCTLLAEFVPKPPRIVVAGYPTVAVYHFAPVRIYRVPPG